MSSYSRQTERVLLDEPSTWQWASLSSLFNLMQLHSGDPGEKDKWHVNTRELSTPASQLMERDARLIN